MDIINFRVSTDGEALELWVRVPDGPYYEDITIKEIGIISWDRYVSTNFPNIFTNPDFDATKPSVPGIYMGTQDAFINTGLKIENGAKEIIKRFPFKQFLHVTGLERSGMYYLYVKVDGIPNPDVPCCCFNETTISCAINRFPIYNLMLKIINAYEDRCMVAEDKLLDLYLKQKLIIDAVELLDYTTANKIFDEIYKRELSRGDCFDGCRTH